MSLNYKMEVDSEEVKRHLDILGYTHIEPSLLNDFIEGKYYKSSKFEFNAHMWNVLIICKIIFHILSANRQIKYSYYILFYIPIDKYVNVLLYHYNHHYY